MEDLAEERRKNRYSLIVYRCVAQPDASGLIEINYVPQSAYRGKVAMSYGCASPGIVRILIPHYLSLDELELGFPKNEPPIKISKREGLQITIIHEYVHQFTPPIVSEIVDDPSFYEDLYVRYIEEIGWKFNGEKGQEYEEEKWTRDPNDKTNLFRMGSLLPHEDLIVSISFYVVRPDLLLSDDYGRLRYRFLKDNLFEGKTY